MLILNVFATPVGGKAGRAISDAKRTQNRNISDTARTVAERTTNRGLGGAGIPTTRRRAANRGIGEGRNGQLRFDSLR